MISIDLARSLRNAGLKWSPERGDHFVVADRGMDDEVFVLSDMTIEVRDHAAGAIIAFNGTTEWALDSLDQADALWLPAESQLRDLLGDAFVRLERDGTTYGVVTEGAGVSRVSRGSDPADAYALALLEVLDASS